MEYVLGIDLGTTNSVVSIVRDGQPQVLRDESGRSILPSVVGFDNAGKLLVGEEARNQALVAPQRTVRSVKRLMGQEKRVHVGDAEYSPQEISAMILRTLVERAERATGQKFAKAVITVPAFFNDNQRQATREAGDLAGLEVLRIINEPTAASLVYEPKSNSSEKLLVYDLGGGTFDVSIVQVESGVIEVLASHGDTQLGGDDFDHRLLNFVADRFQDEEGVDLRDIPSAHSRLLLAVEEAKKRLSSEAFTNIVEEFIAEKQGRPLHLNMTIDRLDYEQLIEPLLKRTLDSVDAALEDAKLTAAQIDRVVLVGGSTRTPLVHRMLRQQLHHELHHEIDPDLCVSLGAAVQGALIAGIDVGPVLVDITPHTLGVQCLGYVNGIPTERRFEPIIERNTALPASCSDIFYTCYDGQEAVEIHVLQGEGETVELNESIGRFMLEGLDPDAPQNSEILVRFELDLDGVLRVTAEERATGLSKEVVIDSAISRFRAKSGADAKRRLAAIFDVPLASERAARAAASEENEPVWQEANDTLARARRAQPGASAEDMQELNMLADRLEQAIAARDVAQARAAREEIDDLLFYLEDAL